MFFHIYVPKNWIDILKTESSVKSIVNIKKDYFMWNNQFINLSTLSNKLLYNKLVNVKFSNPIGTHYWINYLVLSENQIQVVYICSFSNFLKKTNFKCSDGNLFILLFQIKFYFPNGKLLGIVYVISVK
jgi:hypothetical protein